MKTCYIYLRSSSHNLLEGRVDTLIGVQQRLCQGYAINHNYQVAETFKDVGVSGNTLKRKELQQLLVKAQKSYVDAVIISKRDRLSKNIATFNQINENLQKNGIKLISVTEGELTSPRKMLTIIVSIISGPERDTLK